MNRQIEATLHVYRQVGDDQIAYDLYVEPEDYEFLMKIKLSKMSPYQVVRFIAKEEGASE